MNLFRYNVIIFNVINMQRIITYNHPFYLAQTDYGMNKAMVSTIEREKKHITMHLSMTDPKGRGYRAPKVIISNSVACWVRWGLCEESGDFRPEKRRLPFSPKNYKKDSIGNVLLFFASINFSMHSDIFWGDYFHLLFVRK